MPERAAYDEALIACVDENQTFAYRLRLTFSAQEQNAIEEARQRKMAFIKLRSAISSKKLQQMATAYDGVLDTVKRVSAEERKLVRLAKDFIVASHKDDDQMIASIDADIQAHYRNKFVFTEQEQQRVELAQKRKIALMRLRMALLSRSVQPIVSAYDSVLLDTCKNVTREEAERVMLARQFAQALHGNNHQAILSAVSAIKGSTYSPQFVFTAQEQVRIEQARKESPSGGGPAYA